jgi:hypothetical protein
MVYSITFQNLTPPLKQTVLSRLDAVLLGQDTSGRYDYLGASERRHIRTILSETLPGGLIANR